MKNKHMYTSTQLDDMQSRARSLRTSLIFEEVSSLIDGYRALLIERDALSQELARLKADDPKEGLLIKPWHERPEDEEGCPSASPAWPSTFFSSERIPDEET